MVVPLHDIIIHVLLQKGLDQSHVLVIGDSAAIIDHGDNSVQGTVGDDRLLVNIHLQLKIGGVKVGIHPVIRDVPADWPEFAALQNDGVEESQTEQQFLEGLGLLTTVVDFLLDFVVGSGKIRLQAFRRLVGELDAALQHTDRELVAGHGGEPESVVGVDF